MAADHDNQPLTEEELRVLEEMEQRLREEHPKLARAAASSLYAHTARRIRAGVLLFVAGFVMLMLFAMSVWVALAGFGTMVAAGMFILQQLRRLGRDHGRGWTREQGFPLTAFLARVAERFRGSHR
ncbi:MAG TPA: DUF3040 domain-containing protein [Actinomycetota bacterium]|nr:DUF3040 domain-containing protein [Actinomycetota bacterium]